MVKRKAGVLVRLNVQVVIAQAPFIEASVFSVFVSGFNESAVDVQAESGKRAELLRSPIVWARNEQMRIIGMFIPVLSYPIAMVFPVFSFEFVNVIAKFIEEESFLRPEFFGAVLLR